MELLIKKSKVEPEDKIIKKTQGLLPIKLLVREDEKEGLKMLCYNDRRELQVVEINNL